MRRRRARQRGHEPSLVPLADMLTNTVGITVFILIFTVLTAGGVVIAKRLPLEKETQADPAFFLCANGRILPVDSATLQHKFLDPLGKPTSYYAVAGWIERFNKQRVEDEYFVVTGVAEPNYVDLGFYKSVSVEDTITFTPRQGAGETIEALQQPDSLFRQALKRYDAGKQFIFFFVRPDSLDTFTSARDLVLSETTFTTGWDPLGPEDPIRFGSKGRRAKIQ